MTADLRADCCTDCTHTHTHSRTHAHGTRAHTGDTHKVLPVLETVQQELEQSSDNPPWLHRKEIAVLFHCLAIAVCSYGLCSYDLHRKEMAVLFHCLAIAVMAYVVMTSIERR